MRDAADVTTTLLLLAAGLDGLAAGGDLFGAEHGATPGPAVAGLDLPVVVVELVIMRVGRADLADTGLFVADDVEGEAARGRDQTRRGAPRG